ncbi:MAG: glyoxalase [Solirubrobacteraceae bacterium]
MTALAGFTVGDAPAVWAGLGFAVRDDRIRVGGLEISFGDALAVTGVGEGPSEVDGLPFAWRPEPGPPGEPQPNGVLALDHVVIATPDLERTTAALQAAGFELRRMRAQARQAFLLAGPTILEVVEFADANSIASSPGGELARFWGLAFAADLGALAATLGDRVSEPKDAVQPGRRIATLRRGAGCSVPVAFLSPRTG